MSEQFISMKTLRQYEKKGRLRSSKHPTLDISIWNYQETVHYKDQWDEITLMCRALVVNHVTGEIVSRAFGKFFNYEEEKHIETEYKRVFNKADGSLGVLFYYRENEEEEISSGAVGRWIFASRGSFVSEQAIEGKKMLDELYPDYKSLSPKFSYIFEIIYPSNRIVVNYGSIRKLIYLSSFEVDGTEHLLFSEMESLGFDVIEEFNFENMSLQELKDMNIANSEGFVIRYDNGQRVKVKFEDYLKLHRLSTGLNNKKIYELCCENSNIEDVIKDVPDEFNDWVKSMYDSLKSKYELILRECEEYILNHGSEDRKTFFKGISNHQYKLYLSKMYQNDELSTEEMRKLIYSKIDYKNLGVSEQDFSSKVPPKKVATMIFLIGRSGSGKTTWTNNFMRDRKNCIRINRDTIRASIFSFLDDRDITTYYQSEGLSSKEKIVTEISQNIIKNAIRDAMTIIIDNTNLDESSLKSDIRLANKNTIIEYKIFGEGISDEELHLRTVNRNSGLKIPLGVIKKQTVKFNQILPKLPEIFSNRREDVKVIQNPNLERVVVFDIDGTLALNVSGRSPYDMTRLHEDAPNEHVINLCNMISKNIIDIETGKIHGCNGIIICSGRDDSGREATIEWLSRYGIYFTELHMRRKGDVRKDFVVKEEMWRDICSRYYISQMFDDRNQVVDHGRLLGFNVNQVAEGNF